MSRHMHETYQQQNELVLGCDDATYFLKIDLKEKLLLLFFVSDDK